MLKLAHAQVEIIYKLQNE